MDDLVKSLKAQLYDRVASPLLSSFLISWAAWNHRLFVVLMSSDKLKEKFSYIDEVLYPGLHEISLRGFLWPLVSAMILIFFYPIPARWVYVHVRKEQRRLKQIQQQIEDEMPMTIEEARDLRATVRKAAADSERELNAREETIGRLKVELDVLAKEVRRLEEEMSKRPIKHADLPDIVLTDFQLEILAEIAENPEGILERVYLASRPNVSSAMKIATLDQLERLRYIVSSYPLEGKTFVSTADGRNYLVKNDHPLMHTTAS